MYVNRCRVLDFPKISDPRGNLSFIECQRHVPFDIKRIFYIYDVPTAESRGAHAHKTLQQVFICLAGSFDAVIDDGIEQRRVHLNRPWKGLYVPPLIWGAETDFDPGSVCLVLTSEFYCEEDYYYEYGEYLEAVARARLTAAAATA